MAVLDIYSVILLSFYTNLSIFNTKLKLHYTITLSNLQYTKIYECCRNLFLCGTSQNMDVHPVQHHIFYTFIRDSFLYGVLTSQLWRRATFFHAEETIVEKYYWKIS